MCVPSPAAAEAFKAGAEPDENMCVPSPVATELESDGAELVENSPLASPLIMSEHVGAELVEKSST
jgi:hypothetical protein